MCVSLLDLLQCSAVVGEDKPTGGKAFYTRGCRLAAIRPRLFASREQSLQEVAYDRQALTMSSSTPAQRHHTLTQSYGERSEQPNLAPLATYLLRLIHIKRTNLCVSADVNTTTELLQLAEDVGEHICVLKTHADIIDDFSDKTIRGLNEVARRKKFLVFEDRKFGDIGSMDYNRDEGGSHADARTQAHFSSSILEDHWRSSSGRL